jgi:hypothetical protein
VYILAVAPLNGHQLTDFELVAWLDIAQLAGAVLAGVLVVFRLVDPVLGDVGKALHYAPVLTPFVHFRRAVDQLLLRKGTDFPVFLCIEGFHGGRYGKRVARCTPVLVLDGWKQVGPVDILLQIWIVNSLFWLVLLLDVLSPDLPEKALFGSNGLKSEVHLRKLFMAEICKLVDPHLILAIWIAIMLGNLLDLAVVYELPVRLLFLRRVRLAVFQLEAREVRVPVDLAFVEEVGERLDDVHAD